MKSQNGGAARRTTEVTEKPKRRTFTAEYKQRILKEVEACSSEERGALLRREGLYYSSLSRWRSQREEGALSGLKPRSRGKRAKGRVVKGEELEKLRRENVRLKRELKVAETIVAFQKKTSELLGIAMFQQASDESSL